MITFTNEFYAGLLPAFFDENDPRPAQDQLHEHYAHGGGVRPFKGFTLRDWQVSNGAWLTYPEDHPLLEMTRAKMRDETLILFDCQWLAIVQPDGSHIITRVD